MATTITVPAEYGYVVLAATGTFFLGFYHGVVTGRFRKSSGLKYPTPYADSAHMSAASPEKQRAMYLFNCAQRAHGNYLENLSCVIPAMLIAGLKFPLTAAALGAGWLVARVVFLQGYVREDKTDGSGRMAGAPMWLFQLALYGLTATVGYKLLT